MKKILIAALFISCAGFAHAQKLNNLSFSIGGELGTATGNLNTAYSLIIGGSVQADYHITSDAAITGNTGIIVFTGKKIPGTNLRYRSATLIPLLAGVKYYFTPSVYGSAQLGESFFTQSGGGSKFTYAPGVGYKFDEKLDVLLKYTGYSGNGSNGGAVGIRLGYAF